MSPIHTEPGGGVAIGVLVGNGVVGVHLAPSGVGVGVAVGVGEGDGGRIGVGAEGTGVIPGPSPCNPYASR